MPRHAPSWPVEAELATGAFPASLIKQSRDHAGHTSSSERWTGGGRARALHGLATGGLGLVYPLKCGAKRGRPGEGGGGESCPQAS